MTVDTVEIIVYQNFFGRIKEGRRQKNPIFQETSFVNDPHRYPSITIPNINSFHKNKPLNNFQNVIFNYQSALLSSQC